MFRFLLTGRKDRSILLSQMLRLLALTCLLLLAMLCLLDGSASVQNGRAVSADANVAPETVNIGRRVILVADFDVRSEDSASALHHGPAVFRGSRSESTLILSALKCNLGNRNFNMAESVAMPEFPFHVCASQSSLTD